MHGVVPYRRSLAEMKKSSVLVLIAADAQSYGIPAKTFEYLALGRPALEDLGEDAVPRRPRGRRLDSLVDRARRSDVLIYPIAIARSRAPLFAELAAMSGGRSFHLREPRELASTLEAIRQDLRSQYLIGYDPVKPWQPEEPEWRSITVTVDRPGLKVRARGGYSTN